MRKTALIISVFGLMILSFAGYAWAQAPVPISPGSDEGKSLVISGCPTFSWAEVTEATGYKLAVFAYDAIERPLYYEQIAVMQTPVLENDIPVRALSWTPSADQGLCARTYVWYVAAVQWGEVLEWSEGRVFSVDALSGIDAASSKCAAVASEFEGGLKTEPLSTNQTAFENESMSALSLEQVIYQKQTVDSALRPCEENSCSTGKTLPGPIAMGLEGPSNTFYGSGAGSSIDGDQDATFMGVDAGTANTTGTWNTFIGRHAGGATIAHSENTMVGAWSGRVSLANNNTFTGAFSGYKNTTGSGNTFNGRRAGHNNTTGDDNTFVGIDTGFNTTIGSHNLFMGARAGYSNTEGGSNTFVGDDAGYSNTTGSNNLFSGRNAGYTNTTGSSNIFIGHNAGSANTSGGSNTFVGKDAGGSNTTGGSNAMVGRNAGVSNTTGYNNTVIGRNAGYHMSTGNNNTYLGNGSGFFNDDGNDNTFIGYSTGVANHGSGSVFIGYFAGSKEKDSNKLYIANSDTATPLIYGEFDNDLLRVNGTLEFTTGYALSDVRLKIDITPLQGALGKVQALQGVNYKWDIEDNPRRGFADDQQIGLIAQEVEKIVPEAVRTDSNGFKAVSYDKLTAVLVEAVKELKAENDQLKLQVEELRKLVTR